MTQPSHAEISTLPARLIFVSILGSTLSAFALLQFDSALAASAIHITFCTILTLIAHRLIQSYLKTDDTRNLVFYGLMIACVFPIIGGFLAVLFWWVVASFKSVFRAELYDDYQQYIRTKDTDELGFSRSSIQELRQELAFESFIDILQSTNSQLKAQAIRKLAKKISNENVSLLKQALNDPMSDVRLYASTALLEMEKMMNEKIRSALHYTTTEGSAQGYCLLGDLYKDYVESGLLDELLAKHYLRLAIDAYQHSLDIETDQPDTMISYIKCLLKNGEVKRAQTVIERTYTLWHEDVRFALLSSEIYFQLRQFDRITQTLKSVDSHTLNDTQNAIHSFWTQESASA